MKKISTLSVLLLTAFISCTNSNNKKESTTENKPASKELKTRKIPNINNAAEAYFSPDGESLICNAKFENDSTYHVYTLKKDGTDILEINKVGDDACSYYFPDGKHLIWTSTRDRLDLPKGNYSNPKDYPQGAELYKSDLDGNNVVRLTNNEYYDAEVSVSPDGSKILFSRQIDGNLDLWVMNSDGTNEKQITFTPDLQEGGSFYMPDSKTIIYRGWLKTEEGKRGMAMTIYTINDDGTNRKQITDDNTGTNWAPHPLPDGDHFVFVRILPPGNFEIYMMSISTKKQIRLTYNDAFDGFPVVSPDGKTLSFSSNRDAKKGERTLSLYLMDLSNLTL
ncbi:MAG: hypothetical protein GXO79_00295 [Chlorobi bacterium]|nr:hypothetical protein [Chlorobiota bacterium]